MSDTIDDLRALKEVNKEQRAAALETNKAKIKALGVTVQELSPHHLRIAGRFDFWPSTEKWWDRKLNKRGSGIDKLLQLIQEWK